MDRFATSLLLALFLLPFAACKEPASLIKKDASEKAYTLFAAGDTQIGRWLPQKVSQHGPDWPLGTIKSLISGADVAMANLECVVATTGAVFDKGEESRPFAFRARPEMLDVLTEVGFDIMATANNHAMDYGPDAIVEYKYLQIGKMFLQKERILHRVWTTQL